MEPNNGKPPPGSALLPDDVLIVEDDLIIALDLEATIIGLGVKRSRTAMDVAEALGLIAQRVPDFALLDIGLRDETSLAVADRLAALGVRFAFVTGYGARAVPLPRFSDRPKLEKPFSRAALTIVLRNWRRR
jgi:ActR/RegA family two-component response regulator